MAKAAVHTLKLPQIGNSADATIHEMQLVEYGGGAGLTMLS